MALSAAAGETEQRMLEIEGLTRRFGAVTAVDGVTLKVPAGEMVGVIGRSGAGKSTMLRMINRLTDPSEGRILFEGRDVTALRGAPLRAWRSDCAMVFQQFNLVPRLDVLTNVLVGRVRHVAGWRSLMRLWPEVDRAVAISALEQFDMGALAAQRAESLSGGQQQRVAICRALVQEPRIILADEPVASLDPRNALLVMEALAEINRRYGITVLVNLHSLDLARSYCERLIGLSAGRLVFDGPPEALTDSVARELYGLEAAEAFGPAEVGPGKVHPGPDHAPATVN
jgi:phosphonate transport system ATP-binding protein